MDCNFSILFRLLLITVSCSTKVNDVKKVWKVNCPRDCSCEILPYAELSFHHWINSTHDYQEESPYHVDNKDPLSNDLFKSVTCLVAKNPRKLLSSVPVDVQILTILESEARESKLIIQSSDVELFNDLISLDIQGLSNSDRVSSNRILEYEDEKRGMVLSADMLLPLANKLLFLNLERVELTRLTVKERKKANLVVKPVQPKTDSSFIYQTNQTRHRLIFLTNNDEKEILPYDIYKQEIEGYRLSSGLFTELRALTHLRVNDCALKDITWHMFDGLDNLKYLSLQKNNLKFIPEFCFYGTPNLRILSLANNELSSLTSVDLAGLLVLEKLDLSKNNLAFLSEVSLPPFPTLISADFSDNPLISIFPHSFKIMNKTSRLKIGGSALKLEKNAFLGLKNLQILSVNDLDIPVLERFVFYGMPLLTDLKLRGVISSIEFDAFVDLDNLINLDLSHCQLTSISMDAFYGLKSINQIDLSHNNLKNIPKGLFSAQQQPNLKKIVLTGNKLFILPQDFFKLLHLPSKHIKVESILLNRNPWDCNCDMRSWNFNLVHLAKGMAPRCSTPTSLRNRGVFYALRTGALECKNIKHKLKKKHLKISRNLCAKIVS
ncbi:hypothetical protein TKK_0008963 [Trichogramma kaykai]